MHNAKTAQASLLRLLESHIDGPLARSMFRRTSKSSKYSRAIRNSLQSIEFFAQRPASMAPRDEALLQTYLSISLPEILQTATMMAGGKIQALGDAPTKILRMPTGMTTPRRAGDSWKPQNAEDWQQFAVDFVGHSEAYIIPFLDEYCTASAFAKGWRRSDERLVFLEGDIGTLKLAAALVVSHDRDGARILLHRKFASAALRKRYSAAFEIVDE